MKFVFAIFGVLGIAISCVQGIEPLIEVTKWVAWISSHWVELTRAFWHYLLGLIGIPISRPIADVLSGIIYTFSLIIGFRRMDLPGDSKVIVYMKWIVEKGEGITDKIKNRFIRAPVNMITGMVIFAPYVIVFFLIYSHSRAQALTFIIVCGILNYSSDILPAGVFDKFASVVFGKSENDVGVTDDEKFAAAYFVSPIIVLAIVAGVLVVDRVALTANDLLASYQKARCEAGINCKE